MAPPLLTALFGACLIVGIMGERASMDEEIYFETPKAVQASTKNAMKRYAEEQKKAGNPHNLSRVCLMGTVACLHDRSLGTDKITGRARTRLDEWIDDDREKRGAKRQRDQEEAIGNALRPKLLMAEEKLALPAPLGAVPDEGAEDSKATALQAAAAGAEGATGAQLAVLKAHVHALVVAEEVETGALQNAGALPKNASDWFERASRARRKAKEHKYAFSGPRVDNKWHLATYAREKEADESDDANNQTARRRAAYNATADEELWAWFTKGGGKMSFVEIQRDEFDGRPLGLVAQESIGDTDPILRMPLKLTMSQLTQRMVKTKRGRLTEYLKEIFQRDSEWGLATFLLHEVHRGEDSPWAPFIKTLRMRLMRSSVIAELEGTWAAELQRTWDEDAQTIMNQMKEDKCRHNFYGVCDGMQSRSDYRWALWVVRRYGQWVFKKTTGKKFLALVPYAHLLGHRRGAGGNTTLEFDNTIKIVAGDHGEEATVKYDRGPLSDAETLIRYHHVGDEFEHELFEQVGGEPDDDEDDDDDDEGGFGHGTAPPAGSEADKPKPCGHHGNKYDCGGVDHRGLGQFARWTDDVAPFYKEVDDENVLTSSDASFGTNPDNSVRIQLPGVKMADDDLYWFVNRVQEMRRAMNYPPRQTTLWMASQKLLLYGEEADEEEQKMVENANKLLAGKPVTVSSHEEYLMLMGGASSKEEAALVLSGAGDDEIEALKAKTQLYTAIEPDGEHDQANHAIDKLSDGYMQLQQAIHTASPDAAVQKVINRTRDFYVHGVRPLRGLDEVDKLLKRKAILLDECGNATKHVITVHGVSAELLCAVRVHIMNETDVDVLCPAGKWPFHDGECACREMKSGDRECKEGMSKMSFEPLRPVSEENERAAIKSILGTMAAMAEGIPGTLDDDEALLGLSTTKERTPLLYSAVLLRLREKRLLEFAARRLQARVAELDRLSAGYWEDHARTCADFEATLSADGITEEMAQASNLTCVAKGNATDEYRAFFQASEILAARAIADEKEAKRRAWAAAMRVQAKAREVLVNFPINLGKEKGKHNVTLREGQDIAEVLRAFAVKHGLTQAGLTKLEAAVRKKIPEEPALQLAMPVVVPAGLRQILAVKAGENVTEVARRFCVVYNITDFVAEADGSDGFGATVVAQAESKHEKRLNRSVILTVPVSLADGRRAFLEVREGEQHALWDHVQSFAEVYKIGQGMIQQLANVVNQRLPKVAAQINIDVGGGRSIPLRVAIGQTHPRQVDKTIEAFCEVHGLNPEAVVPAIRQGVMGKLHNDALVAPGKPYRGG